MKFLELARKRESVRGYIDKEVEREKIEKCIEAARLSPSACNSQPWKFIVVDDEEKVKRVRKGLYDPLIGINKFVLTCNTFIVVVSEKRNLTSKIGEVIKKKDFTAMDIGIATENLCLEAAEQELGTCIMGWFKENTIKDVLNIPKDKEIQLVISIGYHENTEPRKKNRKSLDEIMSYNEYK